MNWKVRDAHVNDIPAISKLGNSIPQLEVMPGGGFCSDLELMAHFARRGSRLVALDEQDNVIGFAIGSFNETDAPVIPYACLVYVGVAQNHRGNRIGRTLVQMCRAGLFSLGADTVYAWARAGETVEDLLSSEGFGTGHLYRWMEVSKSTPAV